MLAMLTREGVLDARQNEETVRVVDATGRKVGAVLVDLGFLRSDELLPAVRRHYESIILSLFSWTTGRWQIDPNVTAGPQRTRLLRHPIVLVREGLARGYPADKLVARLGTGKSAFLLDNSTGAADVVSQLVAIADKAEMRVPSLFDGIRSIVDVARDSGLSDVTVSRIALTLATFGVLRPVEAGLARGTGYEWVCAILASIASAFRLAMPLRSRATTSKHLASSVARTRMTSVGPTPGCARKSRPRRWGRSCGMN